MVKLLTNRLTTMFVAIKERILNHAPGCSNSICDACAVSEGRGRGPDPLPLENYKNTGFLSNTGPDVLKIINVPIQHSMLGHHRPASETPIE